MLSILGKFLTQFFGPFRLFQSHSILIFIGVYTGFFIAITCLPRIFKYLPVDRGKEYAVETDAASGKPTGSGIFFIPLFALIAFFTVPFSLQSTLVLLLVLLVCLFGYLDDRSGKPWGEYVKGSIDLVLSFLGGLVISWGKPFVIWLPFVSAQFTMPAWLFILMSTVVIWVSINSTNCSDGVDGLSGTLTMVALISLGAVLYFVLGHTDIANYLLLPHYENGARWAIMIFTLVGPLAAYLWYNAYPSKVLMGDAGSRALGFIIGIMVMNTGNPFVLIVIATVLLVNGGTGIVKVALLRFLKIRIFHNTRFPLHDHVKENRQWSNAQILLKFTIIQIMITAGLFGLFFKIR
ncbi:MAG: phospho-N-acetylmuramoyl-pentapeptide-transferase [Spirochaetales bacterium]|nr:phospho-N-acetylmuramoyl-pentapeptide-transferase [Spirochaetales bacterium]